MSKPDTTTTKVQGMTWKCPKCPAWPYLNRKRCFVCGTARPDDVKKAPRTASRIQSNHGIPEGYATHDY